MEPAPATLRRRLPPGQQLLGWAAVQLAAGEQAQLLLLQQARERALVVLPAVSGPTDSSTAIMVLPINKCFTCHIDTSSGGAASLLLRSGADGPLSVTLPPGNTANALVELVMSSIESVASIPDAETDKTDWSWTRTWLEPSPGDANTTPDNVAPPPVSTSAQAPPTAASPTLHPVRPAPAPVRAERHLGRPTEPAPAATPHANASQPSAHPVRAAAHTAQPPSSQAPLEVGEDAAAGAERLLVLDSGATELAANGARDGESESDSWLRSRLPAPGAPLVHRERLVLGEMRSKEDLYTDVHNLSVMCATWNVNGQSPSPREPVLDWLASGATPPDIYAIGFQELDLSKEAFLYLESVKEEEWLTVVLNSLHRGASYRRVRLVRLVGIMLVVLVQERLWAYVRNVSAESVGTGIMGKMGNKGGVAVRMEVHCTSLCFVSSHLAAHVEEYERRNQDYADICHRLRFSAPLLQPRAIKDHDQVFWLGDLNYRINGTDVDRVKELVQKGRYEEVLENDQLRLQLQHGRAFHGFTEGRITFPPTYKYDPGTDNWDSSEKGRAPAWCDRVLWRGPRIALQDYRSHPSLKLSDHKPVSATFQAGVKVIDPIKQRAVYEETMKELDKFENEGLPQVTVDTTEIIFGDVFFYEAKSQTLTISNTGRVTANFSFINKLNETSYCRPWLSVEPACALIAAGDSCEVTLEVRVDERTAARLNTCQEKLYDILVLHLENGKDIFITVQGDYVRSCFGVSLNALVHIKTPFNMVSISQLLDLESANPKQLTHNPYVIPKELWFLVDQLQREGVGKALFLQAGLPSEVSAIRHALDTTLPERLPGSVHSAAEALQLLLASLPEPVIPTSCTVQCLQSCDNFQHSKQIVAGLSPHHKNVFTYICSFLRDVVEKAPADSCVDATTLAQIFGSVMIRNPAPAAGCQLTPEQLARRKTTFVYHFLVNEIDI